MGDFQFIDIVFFAMVALFLVLRLRSVLGKRTGNERTGNERRQPDPLSPTPTLPGRKDSDNVIALPDRGGARDSVAPAGSPLEAGLAEIRAADRGFNDREFVGGARQAFEMILGAFAQGDVKTLRGLLSDEVYANFANEIERREKAGEKLESSIQRMRSVDIVDAKLQGSEAMVTVKFVTDQVNVLRDAKGEPLPEQSTAAHEVVDLWTFARDTRINDPNWLLVATDTVQ
jgi:predicted lipid-binding transport protein (Tim44 family)